MTQAHAVSKPATAASQVRAGYDYALQRQRDAAALRLRRRYVRNIWLAFASFVFIAALLGFGYFFGIPQALSISALSPKPVDPFVESRQGQIRTHVEAGMCRELKFDNNTGKFSGGSLTPCDPGLGAAASPQAKTRLESIRDAFKR